MQIKKITPTHHYKHVKFHDILDDWKGREVYTPDGFKPIQDCFWIKRGKTVILKYGGEELHCDPEHILCAYRSNQKVAIYAKDLNITTDKLVGHDHKLLDFTKCDGPDGDLYDLSIENPHLY